MNKLFLTIHFNIVARLSVGLPTRKGICRSTKNIQQLHRNCVNVLRSHKMLNIRVKTMSKYHDYLQKPDMSFKFSMPFIFTHPVFHNDTDWNKLALTDCLTTSKYIHCQDFLIRNYRWAFPSTPTHFRSSSQIWIEY